MVHIKEMLGMFVGLAFGSLAVLLTVVSWLGLEREFGWQYALAGVGACILMRLGIAIPVGLFYFAVNYWGWNIDQAAVFALPGLLLVVPIVVTSILGTAIGAWRR